MILHLLTDGLIPTVIGIEALKLQRPLPDDALMIVGRGEKKDEGGLVA